MRLLFALLFVMLLAWDATAKPKQICIYPTKEGKIKQVNSIYKVPSRYRKIARCFDEKSQPQNHLSKPDEIDLQGTVRRVNMSSSVGRVELRWPRKVETLFGRTPERAMADAARTVSRALKQAGFAPELRSLNADWKVVFLDENMPTAQVPTYLREHCHPGWMIPAANVYIVAQRVAGSCHGSPANSSRVSDSKLTEVLLHEMGHAIEYQILGGRFGRDRMRAEGFACWFEQFSSNYSSVIRKGKLEKYYKQLAANSIARSPDSFYFQGSGEDYARASMYFHAVVDRRGVGGLMNVYKTMLTSGLDLKGAIKKNFGWSDKKLNEEIERALKR